MEDPMFSNNGAFRGAVRNLDEEAECENSERVVEAKVVGMHACILRIGQAEEADESGKQELVQQGRQPNFPIFLYLGDE
jgi:hypothetical protein